MLVVLGSLLVATVAAQPATQPDPYPATAPGRRTRPPIMLMWKDNVLSVESPRLPGGRLDILYLEAFCRRGSTDRDWAETTIPFHTEVHGAARDLSWLRLRTVVDGKVEVNHLIRAGSDEVTFELDLKNTSAERVDIEWAQPCIRVDTFTGRGQDDYHEKCFIFTDEGLAHLHELPRATEARYQGGQVYMPEGIDRKDVNPRPISPVRPANGLIGCFSADGQLILATAWDATQELFQGVRTCIHSDFRIGGLEPGESKRLRGRLYIVANEPDALLERYRRDFRPERAAAND